jgi:hypothetical protein
MDWCVWNTVEGSTELFTHLLCLYSTHLINSNANIPHPSEDRNAGEREICNKVFIFGCICLQGVIFSYCKCKTIGIFVCLPRRARTLWCNITADYFSCAIIGWSQIVNYVLRSEYKTSRVSLSPRINISRLNKMLLNNAGCMKIIEICLNRNIKNLYLYLYTSQQPFKDDQLIGKPQENDSLITPGRRHSVFKVLAFRIILHVVDII